MNLIVSSRFHKDLAKLARKNTNLKKQISKTLELLLNSPSYPSLRLHKLSNHGDYSISVNMSIRIIFRQCGTNIYLLRIGSHEEVY